MLGSDRAEPAPQRETTINPARSMIKKTRLALTIVITLILTLTSVLIALNFTSGEKNVERKLVRLYQTQDPQFFRAMGSLLGPGILGGNRAQELLNGDQIFPAMLGAIRGAQRSITFETYIYWSGDIGREFAAALADRARAGVKVHVLLDWVGSAKIDDALLQQLQAAGVDVRKFHKPAWYNLARLNNRTHRKLLIVDGKTGFTGGVGIAPQMDRRRPGRRALARFPLPDRRPGSGSNAGGVHGQLAEGYRRRDARRRLLPRPGRRRKKLCPGFFELALGRQRKHAADVSAVDHRSRAQH
jgi:phosphatidylserine/phosphatidylglycerophosphate/cardiolipin synthase-like enzyme